MSDVVSLTQLIADPTRFRVVAALRHGELSVCEISDALEVEQSTVSGHLQVLLQADIATTRTEGRRICYSLTRHHLVLTEALFSDVQPDSDSDVRLGRDSERIARRMALRE